MAVISEIPGVSVTILVDGVSCVEYDDPDADADNQEPRCTTKYIEAVDGKEFAIHFEVAREYDWSGEGVSLEFEVSVDGMILRRQLLTHGRWADYPRGHIIDGKDIYCSESNQWIRHVPKFTAIETTEDTNAQRIAKDAKIAADLGVICIKFCRANAIGVTEPLGGDVEPSKSDLAEKALKGRDLSHCSSFERGSQVPKPNVVKVKRFKDGEGRITFKYRSRAALEHEMVIPCASTRSPSPTQTITGTSLLEGLSDEEVKRLAIEHLRTTQVSQGIKSESGVKREISEVCDLTDENETGRRRKKSTLVDLTES